MNAYPTYHVCACGRHTALKPVCLVCQTIDELKAYPRNPHGRVPRWVVPTTVVKEDAS